MDIFKNYLYKNVDYCSEQELPVLHSSKLIPFSKALYTKDFNQIIRNFVTEIAQAVMGQKFRAKIFASETFASRRQTYLRDAIYEVLTLNS